MADNFDSNITRKLARVFLEKFEAARVVTKNVNTQLLEGKFDPASGDTVDFKRPTDYTSSRNATGDATGIADDIITGKASGVVQDYFTSLVDFTEADQAIKMDQLDELLEPMATRIVTDLELDYAAFMMKNAALFAGVQGTAPTTWSDIANWGAVMQANGVPMDTRWNAMINPFTGATLSDVQRTLGAGGVAGGPVNDALRNATIVDNFAGLRVMTGTTLANFTSGAYGGDLAGSVSSADVTYVTAKDTMTQSMVIAGIGTYTGTIPAGTVWQVTAVNRLNLSTRQPVVNGSGANVLWTATQTADSSFTSGGGTIILSGPAILEAGGSYNTTDATIVGAVITILGAVSTLYQPNLFWHPNAFGLGSVPLKKLFSTDTLATTEDGLQLRVSKFSDGLTNVQSVRFDLRPAYAVLNPFFAGHGWG
jgi:hypothetical protein